MTAPYRGVIKKIKDEFYLILPDDLIEQLNWKIGDAIVYDEVGHNYFTIKKVDQLNEK